MMIKEKSMTVKELIEVLNQYPKDYEIVIKTFHGNELASIPDELYIEDISGGPEKSVEMLVG